MDSSITETVEQLFEKAEAYAKSTVKLGKHVAVYSAASAISNLIEKLALFVVIAFAFIFLNVGLSLYIGGLIGQSYLGFLAVGAFYMLVGLIIFVCKDALIKRPVSNAIITMANKDILS